MSGMKKQSRPSKRLERADIVAAFSGPHLTRRETMELVQRYMGSAPVPPAWTLASVRGVFGQRVARRWARHLRHRPAGVYRDPDSGRWLHPVVQTAYDFGVSPENLAPLSEGTPLTDADARAAIDGDGCRVPVLFDEYHAV